MADGRKRRKELQQFYGVASTNKVDPCYDINSKFFNKDLYVQKVIKEKNLKQLLEEEATLVTDIQRLDSDCQTLVYDHYDKFIDATDIVRQMKEGSVQMENEMKRLQDNMVEMTKSSSSITSALQDRRQNLNRLLSIHSTLKKLEFLFQLPDKIDECIAEGKYMEGVKSYIETAEVLQRYRHLPSFSAIHKDCEAALARLNKALKDQLALKDNSASNLTQYVDLLLQLGEPSEGLCDNFLEHAGTKLKTDLTHIESIVQSYDSNSNKESSFNLPSNEEEESKESSLDILEFVNTCHNTFICDLWLVISSYKEMFLRSSQQQESISVASEDSKAHEKLCSFVSGLVEEYVAVVGVRIAAEEDNGDYNALATALDKFHRRLHAITQLLPLTNCASTSLQLILDSCEARCKATLSWLKTGLVSSLAEAREAIAAPSHVTQDTSSSPSSYLNEHLTKLVATTAANIKNRLSALLVFNQPKFTYAMQPEFRVKFCKQLVREDTIVAFFLHIKDSLLELCNKKNKDPVLLLLLSRMCLDLHTSTIHYLVSHCDAELQLENKTSLTSLSSITTGMKDTGQHLLNYYVTSQGASISQMLRRSVELKDWLGCGEPRSVRRVMKTVRDEISTMDAQVGALYEEGNRKDRSSDSSRRTYHSLISTMRTSGNRTHAWHNYGASSSQPLDNSLVANLNKLWSERIEIFAPVQFTRVSILTGIIKISLKTLLESVRLRTLGKYGLQQLQVDTHYLRTYLWSYVADEQVLNVLLDEILTSASVRCIDPELMEHRVVEFICEQN